MKVKTLGMTLNILQSPSGVEWSACAKPYDDCAAHAKSWWRKAILAILACIAFQSISWEHSHTRTRRKEKTAFYKKDKWASCVSVNPVWQVHYHNQTLFLKQVLPSIPSLPSLFSFLSVDPVIGMKKSQIMHQEHKHTHTHTLLWHVQGVHRTPK